ncbi:hypothetical protein Bca52824_075376 [Brassica carinata]|uniref:Glutaredoxin domain-containing protein n=1 Tax=Brassica carinata TaxID=52824 RepID=A0A8X7TVN1_BRACI|nr:hypothetical protein Bca52824_075376 [Brassica carinata]
MEKLQKMISEKSVVIFSKNSCCMSHTIKTIFLDFGVNPTIYELDDINKGKEIEQELTQLGCSPTVPVVFIGGFDLLLGQASLLEGPPSSAGFCLFLGSRNRGRDLFHAPDLSVRGPLSLVDEGFQHFHETCSLIHPPERPGSEASCLAKCLHHAFARRPLLWSRTIYPLRRSP